MHSLGCGRIGLRSASAISRIPPRVRQTGWLSTRPADIPCSSPSPGAAIRRARNLPPASDASGFLQPWPGRSYSPLANRRHASAHGWSLASRGNRLNPWVPCNRRVAPATRKIGNSDDRTPGLRPKTTRRCTSLGPPPHGLLDIISADIVHHRSHVATPNTAWIRGRVNRWP
jgi:hypothetical protein